MLQTILTVLFPLIAFIAMGYGLQRTNWLSAAFWQGAEKLNYYILFPAMLFSHLASARIEMNMLQDVLHILLVMTVLVCSVLYALKYFYRIPYQRFGVYVQSQLRFNTYIGIAVVSTLFQSAGMTIFAMIMVFFIPVVNTISVLAFTRLQDMHFGLILLSLIKNPLILGCIAGGAFNLTGLNLWEGMTRLLQQSAACSLPLGLMCVGAALRFQTLNLQLKAMLYNTLARLILMPLLAYTLCIYFEFSLLMTQVLVLFFALPTASASYILTKVCAGDSELMASIISLQTLCSGLSLMLILTWLM